MSTQHCKVPRVAVTDDFKIQIGSRYGEHVTVHPVVVDGLIEVLKGAKAWALLAGRSYPEPDQPIPEADPCDYKQWLEENK